MAAYLIIPLNNENLTFDQEIVLSIFHSHNQAIKTTSAPELVMEITSVAIQEFAEKGIKILVNYSGYSVDSVLIAIPNQPVIGYSFREDVPHEI